MSLERSRRTFICHSSYLPAEYDEIKALSGALDKDATVDRLMEMGFTTVVVQHDETNPNLPSFAGAFAEATNGPSRRLKPLLIEHGFAAYELLTAAEDDAPLPQSPGSLDSPAR